MDFGIWIWWRLRKSNEGLGNSDEGLGLSFRDSGVALGSKWRAALEVQGIRYKVVGIWILVEAPEE